MVKKKQKKKTIKFEGGSIMIWGYLSTYGFSRLHITEGRTKEKLNQDCFKIIFQNQQITKESELVLKKIK